MGRAANPWGAPALNQSVPETRESIPEPPDTPSPTCAFAVFYRPDGGGAGRKRGRKLPAGRPARCP
jgi:hypothetical protein